MEGFPSPN